jgi:hypothetical protein
MSRNEDALKNVQRKVGEVLERDAKKLIFGWRPEQQEARKEGDVWEDMSGKKWTVKNGVTQNVTKLDTAKTPFWCPRCTKPLNHRFDLKFWRINGHCMDCQIKEETEIRKQGKWEEYERNKMVRNYIAEVKDKIAELQSYHDTFSKPEYLLMNEHEKTVLMFEQWDVDVEKVKEDLRKDIALLQQNLDITIKEYGLGEENEQVTEVPTGDEPIG